MEIEREYAVGACRRDDVGDQLGRDRGARGRFAVLASVAVIGDDGRHPPRRTALQRVEADEQLHQVVVCRVGGGLNHENVFSPHVLVDLDEYLHIRKAPHTGFGERQAEIVGDCFGERPVAVAGEDLHDWVTYAAAAGSPRAASFNRYLTARDWYGNRRLKTCRSAAQRRGRQVR